MCIDALNGEEVWSTHLKANYEASPYILMGLSGLFSVKGE